MAELQKYVVHVSALVTKDQKLLMARRAANDDQAAGAWATPGGKVELLGGAHVVEQSLATELAEEVGVTVDTAKLKLVFNQVFVRSSGDRVLGLVFLAPWLSGEAKPLEDQSEITWLTMDELEKLVLETDYLEYLRPGLPAIRAALAET